jgi:WD40 repeat protein
MIRYSNGRIPDDSAAVREPKAARRLSIIIGLTLAVAAAAAMYVTLFQMPTSAGPKVVSHKAINLRRMVEFALVSTPDSVQLDPDGKMVVVVADNGKVTAWSTSNRRQHRSFASVPDGTAVGSQYLNPLVFSPDGKELSVIGNSDSGGEVAYIWNVATGRATSVPLPRISSTYPPSYAALGPNGLIATSYSEGALRISAMATRLPDALLLLQRAAGIGYQMGEPAFSPDGRAIAVSDDLGKIYLVRVPRRHLTAVLAAEKIYNTEWNLNGMSSLDIDTLTFSPDSKRVACGSENGIIRVWDVATGRNVSAFNVNGSASGGAAARPVKTLVFSPDGNTLVTADDADSTVAIWDTASGRMVATLEAGTGNVASVAFTANGTLIVATASNNSKHHRIEIWTTRQSVTASS